MGLSQPLVSWHVGRLRAAGLVTTRRMGRETFCRLRPEAFAAFAARQAEILGIGASVPGASVPGAAERGRAAS